MNIRDVKINAEDWLKFHKYIDIDNYIVQIEVSIIIFGLNDEDTNFKDIVNLVSIYHAELTDHEEIQDFYMWRKQLSSVDPIFFQEYVKELYGNATTNYQMQADCGAVCYCENFIKELYEKMNKDGLFDRE